MKFLNALAATILAVGSVANADTEFGFVSEADRYNYYTIDSIEIVPVETDERTLEKLKSLFSQRHLPNFMQTVPTPQVPPVVQLPQIPQQPAPQNSTQRPAPNQNNQQNIPRPNNSTSLTDPAVVNQWITVGERIWQLIANNRPTANISTNRVAVLPVDQSQWARLEGWKGPASYTFTVVARNLLGATVVRHKYTIAWNYGGSYLGSGAYISNLTMIPTEVSVAIGFTLDSRVVVGDAVNISTADDPVPALPFQVEYTVRNVFKHTQMTESYFVTGKGEFRKIN